MMDQLTKEWANGLKERVNNDPEFAVVARLMQVDFLWEAGETRLLFIVKEGKIDDIKLNDEITFNDSWEF